MSSANDPIGRYDLQFHEWNDPAKVARVLTAAQKRVLRGIARKTGADVRDIEEFRYDSLTETLHEDLKRLTPFGRAVLAELKKGAGA